MINLTIRGHDLSQVNSIDQLGAKTQAQGIRTLQLALTKSFPNLALSGKKLNPGLGGLVKTYLSDHQVEIGILSCYTNLIHPDAAIRKEKLEDFICYLQNAKHFGAPIVATETGSVIPELGYSEDNFTEEVFEDLLKVIEQLVKAGVAHQTIVGIEPGLNHPMYSIKRVEALLKAIKSDYLQIILDPTNLITAENYQQQAAITEAAFQSFGDKICALHLKDFVVQNEQIMPVPFNQGQIDYQKILALVEKYRPGCYVVLEQTTDDYIGKAVKILREDGFI